MSCPSFSPLIFLRLLAMSPSPSDVVMSWLRLQIRLECIPHSCHMYTKCLCNRWGGDLRKIGVWLSWSDIVTSWLRLQTPVKCCTHPYHMYPTCFSTLICCGWANESTPTLVGLCNRWGGDLRKIGVVWLSPSDVVMLWLRLQTPFPIECIPHPYHMYAICYCTLLIC